MIFVTEAEFEDSLVEMRKETINQVRQQQRQEQIEYEFKLYKHFCALMGIKKCLVSSLDKFIDYCFENGIELIK